MPMKMRVPFMALRTKREGHEGYVVDMDLEPLAATNGAALVVLRPTLTSAADAIALGTVLEPMAHGCSDLVRILRTEAERARPVEVTVTLMTQPEPELAERTERELRGTLEELALARLEATQAYELAPRGQRTRLKDKLTAARLAHREVEQKLARRLPPGLHAVRVGDAHYDLVLVRECLRALDAREGTLCGGDELGAAVLRCAKGIALIMPFRV